MRLDLPTAVRRTGKRRAITLRPIVPTTALQADLATIYLDIVGLWREAIPTIVSAYSRTLAEITTDSPADIEREIGRGESGFARLVLELTPRLRNWAWRIERWHRERWRAAVLSPTGIDLATILSPTDVTQTVDASVAWNTSLIRDVSDQTRARIGNAVLDAVQRRLPARELAATLRETVAMSRRRSLLIASDQTQKLTSSLDRARQEQAGIDQFKWRHSGKAHPRVEHRARDGNIYSWAKPPADLPGQLPYCGCKAQAHIDFGDD